MCYRIVEQSCFFVEPEDHTTASLGLYSPYVLEVYDKAYPCMSIVVGWTKYLEFEVFVRDIAD